MCRSNNILKKLIRLSRVSVASFIGLAFLIVFSDSLNAQTRPSSNAPNAKFDKAWVDYNVTEGDVKGMKLHLKFTVNKMKNLDPTVVIYFQTGDGKKLRDNNKRYASPSGDVAVYKPLKVDYDPGYYEDLAIFIPYNELDLEEGEYDLEMDIDINYRNGSLLQHLALEKFNFTQPSRYEEAPMPAPVEEPTNTETSPSATMDKAWIDYDVYENGKKGIRIHVKFSVQNLKGVESDLRIRLARQNDEMLKGASAGFTNSDGDLVVTKKLKPGFDATEYEDATVFLPYQEIKLGRGVFNLKVDIDVTGRNGVGFVKHIGWQEFTYRNNVN